MFCFQYLSMSIWAQMICSTSGAMFEAIGRADLMFQRGMFTTLGTISCIVVGISTGSLAITSLLVSISYFSNFVLMLYYLVGEGLHANIIDFIRQLIPDGIIVVLLALELYVICQMEYLSIVCACCVKLVGSFLLYVFLMIKLRQLKFLLPVCPVKFRNWLKKLEEI